MKIVVTGANGYLGKLITEHLISRGHSIIAGVRTPNKKNNGNKITYKKYDLTFNQKQCSNFIESSDAVIHLAYQKKKSGLDSRKINLEGTKNLFKVNAKYKIYFSSMSAHKDAISDYGISKLEIENELEGKFKNVHILKCGLVLSNSGGLYGQLKKIIRKSRLIPSIAGGIQPIHTLYYRDLNTCIDKILNEQTLHGNYLCGEKKSIMMKELYLEIAKSRNKKIKLIKVSYPIVGVVFKVIDFLPININSENLKGLKSLKSFNNENFFPNIKFKTLSQSIIALNSPPY